MESNFQKDTCLESGAGGTQNRGEGKTLKGEANWRGPRTWRPVDNIVGGCGRVQVAPRRGSWSVCDYEHLCAMCVSRQIGIAHVIQTSAPGQSPGLCEFLSLSMVLKYIFTFPAGIGWLLLPGTAMGELAAQGPEITRSTDAEILDLMPSIFLCL